MMSQFEDEDDTGDEYDETGEVIVSSDEIDIEGLNDGEILQKLGMLRVSSDEDDEEDEDGRGVETKGTYADEDELTPSQEKVKGLLGAPRKKPSKKETAKPTVKPVAQPPSQPLLPQKQNSFSPSLVSSPSPFFIIIMGQTGAGKTSLCAQFPSPLFICDPEDQGILRLVRRKLVPEGIGTVIGSSFSKIIFNLSQFAAGQHPYKTLVIEGLFGLENLAKAAATDRDFQGDTSKAEAYGAVTKSILRQEWSQLHKQIRKCLEAGFNVVCTGHTNEKTFSNPTGPDYDYQKPSNTASLWLSISRTAEAVLFMVNEPDMITGSKGTEDQALFQKGKSKGVVTKIYFSESPGVKGAKNQWGISGSIDVGSTPKETYKLLIQKARI